ncbi:stress responsive A/B barrel domain protein [Hypoxylon sp. FL1150]|nr:stress responsive A/B barrel domain protein [Hypoxylon sp. FL1150]
MPVYHVVLNKLNPGVTTEQSQEWQALLKDMVGKIPGLLSLEVNSPLALTAHRSLGFNLGVVSVLEKAEDLKGYATHPAHLKVQELREKLCGETLVYDLEF